MAGPTILRAFLTASGARAINAGLVVVRAKVVALLLGPEGIGLLGLYTAAQEIGAQAADAGLSHSAVREVARQRQDAARAARLRRALAIATVALAAAGALATWVCRVPLSQLLTGSGAHAAEVGLLAIGLFLTVLFRWRQSLLSAYQRVGELSRGLIAGTLAATLAGAGLVWAVGTQGLVWAAIASPACGLIALSLCARPLPRAAPAPGPLAPHWATLVRLGISLMLIAQIALLTPMLIRIWLAREAGLGEAGLFQAAWVVSTHAMTVLLTSVAMDFYPRLSAATGDHPATGACLDRQFSVHLGLGGPVLLALTGLAPLVLEILYSAEFTAAAPLLQGLMIAGLARLVASPLETVLTAAGRPRAVLGAGAATLGVTLAGAHAGHPSMGLAAIGLAFAAGHLLHLAMLIGLARRTTGHAPRRDVLVWLAFLLAAAIGLAAAEPPVFAAIATIAVAGLAGLGRLGSLPCLSASSGTAAAPAAAPRRP